MYQELRDALCDSSLTRATELLAAGADINETDDFGESLLSYVILRISVQSKLFDTVQFMLEHNANPKLIDHEGGGPLFSAVMQQDTAVIQLLLEHGADPNLEHELGETLYDWAEFDYRFETYDLSLPEQPSLEDKVSEDTWLQFLDRIAMKYNKRRPDHLILLRKRGALTRSEQQKAINPY